MGAGNRDRRLGSELLFWSFPELPRPDAQVPTAEATFRRFHEQPVGVGEADARNLQRLRDALLAGSVALAEARRAIVADEAKERGHMARWTKLKRRVQHA